jgi:malate/lactate dehydrogenase
MRLDQNRAVSQLSRKADCPIVDVSNVIIWGNHSSTQVPDYEHAKIKGKPVLETITNKAWLEGEFIGAVQKRGAAIINARGKSSAASAASAAIDAIQALLKPTPAGEYFSSAVLSDGNPYGIQEGLVYSFPCISKGEGKWEIVQGLTLSESLKQKMKATEKELLEERELVKELLS